MMRGVDPVSVLALSTSRGASNGASHEALVGGGGKKGIGGMLVAPDASRWPGGRRCPIGAVLITGDTFSYSVPKIIQAFSNPKC